MAWLNYEPTVFQYRNRIFTYEEMNEIKSDILSKWVNALINDNVFKTLELHPKKIYDDSVLQKDNERRILEDNEENKGYKASTPHTVHPRSRLNDRQK